MEVSIQLQPAGAAGSCSDVDPGFACASNETEIEGMGVMGVGLC